MSGGQQKGVLREKDERMRTVGIRSTHPMKMERGKVSSVRAC